MTTFARPFWLGAAVAAAIMAATASAAGAQTYPWCLVISDKTGSWTCYFASREQCMMSAGGNVGFCTQNPAYSAPVPPPQRRRTSHD